MDSLEIPYAVTKTNEVVSPDAASKGMELQCPECRQPVILKAGPIRRRHFAHQADVANCAFAGESQDHFFAKHMIRMSVQTWKAGESSSPIVHYKCKAGIHPDFNSLHENIATAELEVTLTGKSEGETYRPDVVLRDGNGKVILCIEIYHKHAVPEQKVDKFKYNVIELTAADVLKDCKNWMCRRMWMLEEKKCCKCDDIAEEERIQAERKSNREFDEITRQGLLSARMIELDAKAVELKVICPRNHGRRKIESCPRNVRSWRGRSYAYFELDCCYCQYMRREVGNDFSKERTLDHVLVGIMCAGGSFNEIDDQLGICAPSESRDV